MVIKGKFSRKPPKVEVKPPNKTNPYIESISALKRKPHQQKATDLLYEVADIVMPVMKEYGFKVRNLIEMSPKSDNLLGLNVNRGAKVCLRLRPPKDDDTFLPLEHLIGTMLHELTHNIYGAHDAKFYGKLDELISKQEEYIRKGISGKNFRSGLRGNGSVLQPNGINLKSSAEIRDARLKKLQTMYIMGAHKLGGNGNQDKDSDLKELVRRAAIKRYEDNKWCNSSNIKEDLPSDDELLQNEKSEKGNVIGDGLDANRVEKSKSNNIGITIDLTDQHDEIRPTKIIGNGGIVKPKRKLQDTRVNGNKLNKAIEVIDLTDI